MDEAVDGLQLSLEPLPLECFFLLQFRHQGLESSLCGIDLPCEQVGSFLQIVANISQLAVHGTASPHLED
jgi:hypothetical protein